MHVNAQFDDLLWPWAIRRASWSIGDVWRRSRRRDDGFSEIRGASLFSLLLELLQKLGRGEWAARGSCGSAAFN
jgi:hypothetical protein